LTHRENAPNLAAVNLVADYKQQYGYRAWARIFDALPHIQDHTVLDLGCGIGDQTAELVARGARVIGIDANEELLAAARARHIHNAEFRAANLHETMALDTTVDGIWCSFGAAYFTNLTDTLARWAMNLRASGWIALTEIDDMFGHEPMPERSRTLLDTYVQDSLRAGRYDFRMGRKLRSHLENAGFHVKLDFSVPDHELAFDGPASDDVLTSWRHRFARMKLLQDHCGTEFDAVRDDFLACLVRDDHRALAKVHCVVAIKRES
jgi:SAM-dependent methyltransferase